MSETLRAIVLAVIQGLTEFLPISSSAHLILPAQLWGWPDQGLAFDVAVHLGSLLAVVYYFRSDLWQLARGGIAGARACVKNPQAANDELRMLGLLALASMPVALAGLTLRELVATELRGALVIAGATLVFGVLLGFADRRRGTVVVPGWRAALIIGLAQVLALIPGTSRSGITITAALFCGLERQAAARFSFLLSIPVIVAASVVMLLDVQQGAQALHWQSMLIGVVVSSLAAYASIAMFLKLLDRIGLMPFVVYRCLLGGALFFVFWGS